jgi:uncharacterized membrane protein YccC
MKNASSSLLVGPAHQAVYAIRCSTAATLSYLLAVALNIPNPVWAAMSALIVSQETFNETRHAAIARLVGTIVGIVVTVAVGLLMAKFKVNVAAQIALSVALTAVVAERYPSVRVCMLTCPVVLLTINATSPLLSTALHRCTEVLLGALIGAALHLITVPLTRFFSRAK